MSKKKKRMLHTSKKASSKEKIISNVSQESIQKLKELEVHAKKSVLSAVKAVKKRQKVKVSKASKVQVLQTLQTVKIPLYVKEAIDLIINKMSYADVAKKYQRTKSQVYWLSSKLIRRNFKTLWDDWHVARKNKTEMNIPFYMTIISDTLLHNKSLKQIAKDNNKTVASVKRTANMAKKYLPYMWELMNKKGVFNIKKG